MLSSRRRVSLGFSTDINKQKNEHSSSSSSFISPSFDDGHCPYPTHHSGGSSESMVSSITAELKTQTDGLEALSPTIAPLQDEITALEENIETLNSDIANMKAQVATNATDKSTKADTIANTENDIKILKQSIEEKKAEIDPLPGQIEETVDECERLEALVMEYKVSIGVN